MYGRNQNLHPSRIPPMSADNTFRISEWICKDEKWASAPSMLRKIAAAVFAVPQELELDLLPSSSLSIATMLDFTLPLEHPDSKAPKPTQYFSSVAPDISDKDLLLRVQCLPIPDMKTVHRLQACSRQAWMDGARSVVYSHLTGVKTHFPLWILTYWVVVIDIKRNARTVDYRKAGRKNPERSALAQQAMLMLTMVPWGCSKPEVDSEPFALGRGERKKFVACHYQGPAWEEH
ncbi:hypothetical protein C8F04DRAFT_1181877 [Mycena alexandri]|uniref:Uncharacterized protein n=1 Tax=Mycena alexandri TaxID=1745969 RepID=A0AAD6SZC9_9AGAR|nr:hypothetical protein C8F04DRAFT_1181877 [Mycena alexandri]